MPPGYTVNEHGVLVPKAGGGNPQLGNVQGNPLYFDVFTPENCLLALVIVYFFFDVQGVFMLLVALFLCSAFTFNGGGNPGARRRRGEVEWNSGGQLNNLEGMRRREREEQRREERRRDVQNGALTALAAAALLNSGRRRRG